LAAHDHKVRPLTATSPYLIGSNTLGKGSSQIAVTVTTAPNPKDVIVVCAAATGGDAVTGIVDSLKNSYKQWNTGSNPSNALVGSIWACLVPATLVLKQTVTITFNNTAAHNVFVIGVPGVTGVDVSVAAAPSRWLRFPATATARPLPGLWWPAAMTRAFS
jgi:hypothetical protein